MLSIYQHLSFPTCIMTGLTQPINYLQQGTPLRSTSFWTEFAVNATPPPQRDQSLLTTEELASDPPPPPDQRLGHGACIQVRKARSSCIPDETRGHQRNKRHHWDISQFRRSHQSSQLSISLAGSTATRAGCDLNLSKCTPSNKLCTIVVLWRINAIRSPWRFHAHHVLSCAALRSWSK